jgi:peptide/nickel transport system substrate-binding protein
MFLPVLCALLASLLSLPAAATDAVSRLIIASSSPIDTLDPHVVLDTRRSDIRLQLYDGLFRWLDGPLRIAPWLAASYTASEDGRTFRFMLRKDAHFHDGREVRASDVVYSVERILALKRGLAPLLSGLISPGSTKAVDNQTVEFNLNRPSPLFFTLLPEIAIVNAELLKANELNNDWGRGWLQTNEAGSGAYTYKARTPTGAVVAARFAEHWSKDWAEKPIEEIELRAVLDPEERVESLLKGELHVLQGNLLPHHLKRLREANKEVAVIDTDAPRAFLGLLHAGRDLTKVQAFRRALAQAFDTDRFIASTIGPGAVPLTIPMPPTLGAPPAGLTRPRFDLAAAADAIAKLKLPVRELTIGAIAGDLHSERAALIMLDALVKLGIPARIIAEPWPAVSNRMRDEKQMYDILFLWRGTRYLDANNWLGELFDCDLFGAGNPSWYCNRDADRLIKEARGTTDATVRRQTFEKAGAILAEDQAGLFVASARRPVAYLRRVKGLRIMPVGEAIDPRMATID